MYTPRPPASARYIRSLKLPNSTSGGVSRTARRTAALSVLAPGVRAIANVQGSPISSSR